MIKRRLVIMLAVVAMMMGAMAPASAGDAACVDGGIFAATDWVNHGSHIAGAGGYVDTFGSAGGGLPAHFDGGVSPGATFCNQHGSSMAPDLPARP